MSKVQINNVVVLNNPATLTSQFQFEITFDCMEKLEDDLEWKLTYVGSAESSQHDQVLDTIYVGPVPEGRHMFVFQTDAPDASKIPVKDVLGATVVLISCSYHEQEFIRVGYFVNNHYEKEETKENPPETPDLTQPIVRSIMAEEPRVTRFKINWGDGAPEEMPVVEGETNGHTEGETNGLGAVVAGQATVLGQDQDSMLEPLQQSAPFKEVHSMDESSNVEMEMAF